MLEIECFGFKKIVCAKYKARWVGDLKKIIRQLCVSLKSYLVYPFVKKENRATQIFFESVYSSTKVDDLIFDGNDHLYFEKVETLIDRNIRYDCIYDCGCGNGSFYRYAFKTRMNFGEYIGIDFAIEKSSAKNGIKFVKTDIEQFDFIDRFKSRLVVLCNVACYLSDEKLDKMLRILATTGTRLLIIDPVPSLFWDATFENVKLFYRKPRKVMKVIQTYGYTLESHSKDYLIKIGSQYMFPLSYASIFCFGKKVREEDAPQNC